MYQDLSALDSARNRNSDLSGSNRAEKGFAAVSYERIHLSL